MVDLGKSDKMIKISGKVDKSNTDNCIIIFRSSFCSSGSMEVLWEKNVLVFAKNIC